MKPLLTNSQQTLIDTMPKCLRPISSLLTTNEQIGVSFYHMRILKLSIITILFMFLQINQDKHLIEKISRDVR